MRRDRFRKLISGLLCAAMLTAAAGCGASAPTGGEPAGDGVQTQEQQTAGTEETGDEAAAQPETEKPAEEVSTDLGSVGDTAKTSAKALARPMLIEWMGSTAADDVNASVENFDVKKDLSNVINADRMFLTEEQQGRILNDGFFVYQYGSDEFFEIYEWNRYNYTPSFITVDSLMHTYHLYFMYLLKNIERDHLFERLDRLTDMMLEESLKQKSGIAQSKGDAKEAEEWAKAADRNIAFFAIGKALLDPGADVDDLCGGNSGAADIAKAELALIDQAAGIDLSPLAEEASQYEDYTQYIPRGYYDTDPLLSRYFKAMMWYGRVNFAQSAPGLDRSALLMSVALSGDAFEEWAAIYAVTSFFAGTSDDNGVCEYMPLIYEAYGIDKLDAASIAADSEAFAKYHEMTAKLAPPAINSVPSWDDGGLTDKRVTNEGFRFMGQRFSIDASIFQNLIYASVGANENGDYRMLPDALDVPAALGSDLALKVLQDTTGASGYLNYDNNMTNLRKTIAEAPEQSWYASLYAGWLDTLRPLLNVKGEGYPSFMQSELWHLKDLECFLGSYTELKHDTVLYSKQVMAEMGGDGDIEPPDDRGYVEPEPQVYARFVTLTNDTMKGLEEYGLLSDKAKTDLKRLGEIAETLRQISVKELSDELATDDEFEFIRCYGGEIEHFWKAVYEEDAGKTYFSSEEYPAPVVVDVATDPNGSVLQLGTAEAATMMVLVPLDGTLRLARGSVYSFYQFENAMSERLTDHEWRVILGIDPDDNGNFNWERVGVPAKPEWTMGYRLNADW